EFVMLAGVVQRATRSFQVGRGLVESGMRRRAAIATVVALAGCQTYPEGVAATEAQAIAIANRDCGNAFDGADPKGWGARLDSGTWTVWQRHDRLIFYVEIDAKTGRLGKDGCSFTPAP